MSLDNPPEILRQSVSYSSPAQTAQNLLQDLSVKAGVKLSAGPDTADEVVMVHANDEPLSEVMERLAEVTGAAWEARGDSYVLGRSLRQAMQQEDDEQAKLQAEMRKQIKALHGSLEMPWNHQALTKAIAAAYKRKHDPKTSNGPVPEYELQFGPVPRALARILADIPVDELAAIKLGWREVYCIEPNASQRKLGSHAREALRLLQEEQMVWGKALKSALPTTDPDAFCEDERSGSGAAFFGHTPMQRSKPFPELGDVRLSIYNEWGSTRSIDLTLLDKNGEAFLKYEFGLYSLFNYSRFTRPDIKETPLALSKEQADYFALTTNDRRFSVLSQDAAKETPPPDKDALREKLGEWLAEPGKKEPAELLVGASMRQLASAKSQNWVVSIPDRALAYAGYSDGLESFTTGLRSEGVDIQVSGGWAVIKPVDPDRTRRQRTSRAAMQALASEVVREGGLTANAYLDFTKTLTPADYMNFFVPYVAALSGSEAPTESNRALMQLYACLSREQRNKLLAGQAITYGELSSAQMDVANRTMRAPATNMSSEGGNPEMDRDITDELPNGLPADGKVKARLKSERIVELYDPAKKGYQLLDRVYLDNEMENHTRFNQPPFPKGGVDKMQFQLFKRDLIEVRRELYPGYYWIAPIEMPMVPVGSKGPIGALPAEAQDPVRHFVKSWMDLLGSGG